MADSKDLDPNQHNSSDPNCQMCNNFVRRPFDVKATFRNLRAIGASATEGCFTCSVVAASVRQILRTSDGYEESDIELKVRPEGSSLELQLRLRESTSLQVPFEHLEIYTAPDQEVPWKMKKIDDTCDDPGGTKALHLIRSNLKLCRETHTTCKSRGTARGLPTRVLDVGFVNQNGERSTALVERKGLKAPYLALSHCWGNQDDAVMPTTTIENIQIRKKEIPISSLPPTFRDAITLARKLQIQYLWIDSLCILQNESTDWEKESLQMAMIYQNARLVISAASAPNCNSGLFARRTPPIKLRVHQSKSSFSTVYVRPKLLPHRHGDFVNANVSTSAEAQNPLFARAWAFQERLSARRAIHFCSDELVWECNSSVWCECGYLRAINSLQSLKLGQNEILTSKLAYSKQHPATHLIRRLRHWEEMIRQFTRRSLTYDYDRLPALSSLAESMRIDTLGTYYAGIWSYSLLQKDGLCWRRRTSGTKPEAATRVRSSQYCAPTWSWASVSGEIELNGVASLWPSTGNRQYDDILLARGEVLQIQTTLLNIDLPFSSVATGHITIKGLWNLATPDEWHFEGFHGRKAKASFEGLEKTFYPDFDLDIESGYDSKHLICIWLESFSSMVEATDSSVLLDYEVIIDVALVLERSEAVPGTYERLGLLIVCTYADDLDLYDQLWTQRTELLKTSKGIFTIV